MPRQGRGQAGASGRGAGPRCVGCGGVRSCWGLGEGQCGVVISFMGRRWVGAVLGALEKRATGAGAFIRGLRCDTDRVRSRATCLPVSPRSGSRTGLLTGPADQ